MIPWLFFVWSNTVGEEARVVIFEVKRIGQNPALVFHELMYNGFTLGVFIDARRDEYNNTSFLDKNKDSTSL